MTKSTKKEVAGIVHRNIRTMLRLRQEAENSKSMGHRLAGELTSLAGSLPFVLIQAVLIVAWIALNTSTISTISSLRPFDPFPFPLLCLLISAEAIFLAIFILVNQNQMAETQKKREELDIQISLLTEHEVTKLIELVDRIAKHLMVKGTEPEIRDLKQETSPEKVLQVIEKEMDRLEEQDERQN